MLTFEKVLEVFNDFLSHDTDCEVVMTSRGYVILDWEGPQGDSGTIGHCATPEDMMEALLTTYHSELTIRTAHDRTEDPTEQEADEIDEQCEIMRKRCHA